MSNTKILFEKDSSKTFNEEMVNTILQLCQDLIPDPLIAEDVSGIEKEIQDELSQEFKDGCFKVEFGNVTSVQPTSKYYYHYKCECFEGSEVIYLVIGYDP